MGNQRTTRLLWALCGLLIGLIVILSGAELLRQVGTKTPLALIDAALFTLVQPVVFTLVGALIVSRYPRHALGWLLLFPVGAALIDGPIALYLQRAPTEPTPTLLLIAWFSTWSWLLLIVPVLHIVLLFPHGQPPTPRWRWVSRALLIWAVLFVLMVGLDQQFTLETRPELVLENPIGVPVNETGEALSVVWVAGQVALVALCVAAPFVRYRRANATERQQIKWLLSACALFLLTYIAGSVSRIADEESLVGDIFGVILAVSILAVPAAIGIAILRHRLFDIDLIIRRTLVYGALAATLLALYLGGVVLLQAGFRALTGQTSELAIIISTLVSAALFQPLRARVRQGIDRRFYRERYDAVRTVAAFSARLRDEVDLPTLRQELVGVVQETLQPAHVSLWIRPASSMSRSVVPGPDQDEPLAEELARRARRRRV